MPTKVLLISNRVLSTADETNEYVEGLEALIEDALADGYEMFYSNDVTIILHKRERSIPIGYADMMTLDREAIRYMQPISAIGKPLDYEDGTLGTVRDIP